MYRQCPLGILLSSTKPLAGDCSGDGDAECADISDMVGWLLLLLLLLLLLINVWV